jgi:DNA polymerase elongation subunit (family B)
MPAPKGNKYAEGLKNSGAPTKLTNEVVIKICDIIASSNRSIASIAKELNLSPSVIYLWLKESKEFLELYTRAKEWQADFLAEEILEISDDSSEDIRTIENNGHISEIENKEFINRSRLRVESRKWLASKLKPQKYGDSQKVEHSGEIKTGIQMTDDEFNERLLKAKKILGE